MTDFKIKRGRSDQLFSANGKINSRLVIEEDCWYLCTDTAELFLGVLTDDGLTLKRINSGTNSNLGPDMGGGSNSGSSGDSLTNELEFVLAALTDDVAALKGTKLFQKIAKAEDLPTDFEAEDFNPNITYYTLSADNAVNTFIFDIETKKYICTNIIDDVIIQDKVSDAVESALEKGLEAKLPEAIKNTLKTVILYGGNATGH